MVQYLHTRILIFKAMCRTCRYIDPGPFIPGRWPPDEGSPDRRSRLSVTLTGRRLPPPQALGLHPLAPGRHSPPPPPSARPGPASRCGGTPRTPRHGISSAKNESADFGGLKIDPKKSTRLQFFAPKGAPFIFGPVLKKSRRSNGILRKIFTKTFPVRVLSED